MSWVVGFGYMINETINSYTNTSIAWKYRMSHSYVVQTTISVKGNTVRVYMYISLKYHCAFLNVTFFILEI